MIQIVDKSQCCGCTACASICPHNAISMEPDVLGFLYPIVDVEKCTNCGYHVASAEAPLVCPACNHKQEYFIELNEKLY